MRGAKALHVEKCTGNTKSSANTPNICKGKTLQREMLQSQKIKVQRCCKHTNDANTQTKKQERENTASSKTTES